MKEAYIEYSIGPLIDGRKEAVLRHECDPDKTKNMICPPLMGGCVMHYVRGPSADGKGQWNPQTVRCKVCKEKVPNKMLQVALLSGIRFGDEGEGWVDGIEWDDEDSAK